MEAILFDRDKHWDDVKKWLKHWDIPEFQEGWLPTVGLIIPGVACAWLYFTDSDVAMIENLISNPEASDEDRGNGLDVLAAALAEFAKKQGAKWLMGQSANGSVVKRAQLNHGFIVVQQPVYQMLKVL